MASPIELAYSQNPIEGASVEWHDDNSYGILTIPPDLASGKGEQKWQIRATNLPGQLLLCKDAETRDKIKALAIQMLLKLEREGKLDQTHSVNIQPGVNCYTLTNDKGFTTSVTIHNRLKKNGLPTPMTHLLKEIAAFPAAFELSQDHENYLTAANRALKA